MENNKPGKGLVFALALLMFTMAALATQASGLSQNVSSAAGSGLSALAAGSTVGTNSFLQQKLEILKTLVLQLQSLLLKLDSLQAGTGQSSSASGPWVTAPNGGERWSRSNSETISWTGNSPADIYLSQYFPCFDATPKCAPPVQEDRLLASNINGGNYFWTISDEGFQTPGSGDSTYKIKIIDKSNPDLADYSDTYFTIGDTVKTSSIRITAPTGQGQQLVNSSDYKVKWQGSGPVDIYLTFPPDSPCTPEICPMGYKKEIKVASNEIGESYIWRVTDEGLAGQAGDNLYVLKITPSGDKTSYGVSGTFYVVSQ